MNIEEYEKMYNLEENYWWYASKRRLIFGFLKELVLKAKPVKLLDVGIGTGMIVKSMARFGEPYGIDFSSEALRFCKLRNLKNIIHASATALPFGNNTFDIVGCFDVLYHKGIKDDSLALKEMYRVCKKRGYLIITDSALKCLWSKHDIIQHARIRYNRKEIKEKLKKAGFEIKKLSYYYFFTFLPLYVSRKLDNVFNNQKKPLLEAYKMNKLTSSFLNKIMQIEYLLIKYMNFPLGSTIFCIAKKV